MDTNEEHWIISYKLTIFNFKITKNSKDIITSYMSITHLICKFFNKQSFDLKKIFFVLKFI